MIGGGHVMSGTTTKAVETWNLSEVLAVLCQVAQDAGETAGARRSAEDSRIPGGLPAQHDEERRR
jgi:hypothetical protein